MSKPPEVVALPPEELPALHDRRLAGKVAAVLMSYDTVCVKFTYAGVSLSYYQYYNVGHHILDGHIFIAREIRDPGVTPRDIAAYNQFADCMLFPPDFDPSTHSSKGNIIHEATHAVCDMLKVTIHRSDAELMAYVAQAMYLRDRSPDYNKGQAPDSAGIVGRIRKAAFAIGDEILNGKESTAFSPKRVQALKHAMGPVYGFGGKKDKSVFNGIGAIWRLGER